MPTNDEKINQLYKNYFGTANTKKDGEFFDEGLLAINNIFSENILISHIPTSDISKIPQLVADNNWKDSSDNKP